MLIRCNNTTYTNYNGSNVIKIGVLPKMYGWTMIQFMIIIMLHYNHSTIMQYFYIAMAIRSAIYTINTVCCTLINTVNLNIIAVIIQSI